MARAVESRPPSDRRLEMGLFLPKPLPRTQHFFPGLVMTISSICDLIVHNPGNP